MAELNFTENEGKYVAEVKVTADFNLHIEREGSGFLNVSVRTTEDGAYDSVKGASFNYADPVVDCDFTGVIYPKYIKIVSKVQPTKAVITSAGEVEQVGGTKKFSVDYNGDIAEFEFEDGMTWKQWCDSAYNTRGLAVGDGFIGVATEYGLTGRLVIAESGGGIYPEDEVLPVKYSIIIEG